MDLRSGYRKFKKHLDEGGISYALLRGLKYAVFLAKKQTGAVKETHSGTLIKGRLKIAICDGGIKILWDNSEITRGQGLNVGINTLGLWTDSARADWQAVSSGADNFTVKASFQELPLTLTWSINIKDESEVGLRIDAEMEEWLHIDELRIVCLLNDGYKGWLNDHCSGDFPPTDKDWHDLYPDNRPVSLVGARLSGTNGVLPPLLWENEDKEHAPVIQNTPIGLSSRIIGFRKAPPQEKRDFSPGRYNIFSGRIKLFEDEDVLEKMLRRDKTKAGKRKRRLKVMLVNLPWQRNGEWGVRAGSRWPHIKDKSEGDYLPFPFFLAHATSLLRKHGIEAGIIDAIADRIGEGDFIEKISGMEFDYLVAETSIPSFYHDLEILEKLHRRGMQIIICGPNSETHRPEFMKENPFIEFVLCGEYEFILLDLIRSLQGNGDLCAVKGLIYRRGTDTVINPKHNPLDVDLMPWPEREQLPMEKYQDMPGDIPYPSVQMLASRNCSFGCNFCLWPQVLYQNRIYRARNVKDVIDEMEYLVRERNFRSVYFDDDTFNMNKGRMLKFCGALKERGLDKVPWAIMARPDLMDGEILSEMRSSGLWTVKYGVESISDKLLDNCNKNMDFQKTDRMIKMTKDLGIKMHLTFTFGISGETRESIRRTVDYAIALEPDSVQFSILTPFPGTRLFDELARQGRILTRDWSKYDGHYHCVFKPDNLSAEELEKEKRRAYILWGEYQRRKRGLRGDVARFLYYLRKYGPARALRKTMQYLGFVWIKRRKYLNE